MIPLAIKHPFYIIVDMQCKASLAQRTYSVSDYQDLNGESYYTTKTCINLNGQIQNKNYTYKCCISMAIGVH